MKKKLLSLLLVGIIPVAFLSGCGDKPKTAVVQPVIVNAAKVEAKTIPINIETFGNLVSQNNVDVKAQISGQIDKVNFIEGSHVKKGELLFEINSDTYQAQLDADNATLKEDMANVNLQKYYVTSNASLAEKGALPIQTYQKMKVDLEMALAKVEADQASIKMDEIQLARCKIYSPIDGVAGLNRTSEGNVVSIGDTLVNIQQISPLRVNFTVPAENLERIENAIENKSLSVKLIIKDVSKDGYSYVTSTYDGTLDQLNNQLNNNGSTITLSAIVDNKNEKLLPGEYSIVVLNLGDIQNAVMVPVSAIQTNSTGTYVFVINPQNKAQLVYIKTGNTYNNWVQIVSDNIKIGERVVTVGQQNLNDNSLVAIVNDNSDSGKK